MRIIHVRKKVCLSYQNDTLQLIEQNELLQGRRHLQGPAVEENFITQPHSFSLSIIHCIQCAATGAFEMGGVNSHRV